MIKVSHLTKSYGKSIAVDDLDFEVKPGIVTGFLGPNGAGKSTTMRMIVGLDQPTKGSALIDGKKYSDYKRPLEKVGTLLDAKWMHPSRSAANHLRWMAAANGISKKRVDEVLGIVGLSDVAGRKAGGYSLGMGQRLGLAGALLGDPEVLILDEPVNGLDPEGIRWVRQFVRALAAEGRTVLVSSHLLSEMAQTADHLIVIGRGRLIANTSTRGFIKSASESSVVVRSDHLKELGSALQEENVEFHNSADADGRPTVVVPNRDSDWVGALAYSYGLRLRELSEVRPSLEEAFMRMTGDSVQYQASVAPNGSGPLGSQPAAKGGHLATKVTAPDADDKPKGK
ncbi:ABC transporter ATP-binding protein [uncultured Corynebacterium sp.]|uniref:ABC transporter ATP-binding protein n=1 Tax=uncultured Corynebacterium sp. TaxID=159447 RepID=UPI0025E7C998|nr:ABC transporter ATP-binding protein [uncultured Corynebacterium sp.]